MTKIPSLKLHTGENKILTVESFRKKKDGEYHIKGFLKGEAILSEDVLEKLSAKKNLVIHVGKNLTLNLGDITKDLLLSISGHGKVKVHEQTGAHIRTSGHIKLEMDVQKGGSNTVTDKSAWHIGQQHDGYNFVDQKGGAHLDVKEALGGQSYYYKKAKSMEEVLGKDAIPEDKMTLGTVLFKAFFPVGFQQDWINFRKIINKHPKIDG